MKETVIAYKVKIVWEEGIVRDVDRTGHYGWIRVELTRPGYYLRGYQHSFRFDEVKLLQYTSVVTKSGLKIRIKKR